MSKYGCDTEYRARFALTMAHKPVDRCPIDLAGTPLTGIESRKLAGEIAVRLGFSGPPPGDYLPFDRRILERFDVDFRRCGGLAGFDTGTARRTSAVEQVDCFGIRRVFSGKYWEIAEGPLQNASADEVLGYEFPLVGQIPPKNLETWAAEAKYLYENMPYVIVAEHPVWGVLEFACWLCGYDHIMLKFALDPDFIHLLFGKILDFQKAVIREYYGKVGRYVHVTTSGDDFGTQKGPFMSPAMWREFVKPYMKERIECTRQYTDAVYWHHSCGSIFDIIPDLAEIGVGVLNPIQPAAKDMEPERLKAAYGDIMVFHGGLDTQEVLPSNVPGKIVAAVEHLMSVMKPGSCGGYIFSAAHNIQDDVSADAVIRMYEAALRQFP
ncbi:MAG TPA: methyltransferase [Planctomycetes bacterium]|nr:methyltransferase [Planctomycetota bacterium]